MIITRTPFRISFFGGGTDYPVYFREHGGMVLSTTINKYCYVTVRHLPPFFDHSYRMRYAQREETRTIDEIQHPSARECLRFMAVNSGVEMVHTSDIPAMSGVGSSSAFTVGFLLGLNALQGRMVTKRKLALDAIHVEQDLIGECVGSQDQVSAAFGGLNAITFRGHDDIMVTPVTIARERLWGLQNNLMMCFVGFSRFASEIAKEQVANTPQRLKELGTMRQMADHALEILANPSTSLDEFGRLLGQSWALKRQLSSRVTTGGVDEAYQTALSAGALGGKLCGAGGGGFMLLYVRPENQARVREALSKQLFMPFRFESLGSHVAFYAE